MDMDPNATSSSGERHGKSSGPQDAVSLLTGQLTASMESTLSTALNGFHTGLDSHLSQLRTAAEPPGTTGRETTSPVPAQQSQVASLNQGMQPSQGNSVMQGNGNMPAPSSIATVPLIQTSNQSHIATDQSLQLGEQIAMGSTTPSKPQATKPIVVGPNTTLVSQSLVQKVRNQEFIELAELLADNTSDEKPASANKDKDTNRKKRKITNILQWVECFNAYIIILDQPERTPDLLAYSSLIVHAARKFKGDGWISYDRNFRK